MPDLHMASSRLKDLLPVISFGWVEIATLAYVCFPVCLSCMLSGLLVLQLLHIYPICRQTGFDIHFISHPGVSQSSTPYEIVFLIIITLNSDKPLLLKEKATTNKTLALEIL